MVGKVNQTLEKVKECLDSSESFIVEAGAGSGKTWTLIESIKYILEIKENALEKANQQIACITYTNVAKNEISERIDNNSNVLVLTIHEFLWHVMQNYQMELKAEIIKYNQLDKKKPVEDLENKIQKVKIDYSQNGRKFEKGNITHEDVLEFSSALFKIYPKLSSIVANKYPYIFIDEYQDTEQRTVDLLLDNLLARNKTKIVLGFFGDSMQKIYNQGIGKIPQEYIDNGSLKFITKNDNYRCSIKVIDLLAKIRPDLLQTPSGKNLEGEISFIHCNNNIEDIDNNFGTALEFLKNEKGWKIDTDTKILLLTHRGIANKLGYEKLLTVYDSLEFGRDRLFNKEEIFANFFLNKVENLVSYYQAKNYRDFIKQLGIEGFQLNSHSDKKKIQVLVNSLIELRKTKSVKELMEFVFENKLLTKPIRIEEFEFEISKQELDANESKRKYFYDELMKVKYSEFVLINNYIENFTPFSTKHGVKGAEYENVLVVIDDNSWNQYKFNDVFANIRTNQSRYQRTLNLLYVCCSRAKRNLTLLSISIIDRQALDTINKWFGIENVYDINNIK